MLLFDIFLRVVPCCISTWNCFVWNKTFLILKIYYTFIALRIIIISIKNLLEQDPWIDYSNMKILDLTEKIFSVIWYFSMRAYSVFRSVWKFRLKRFFIILEIVDRKKSNKKRFCLTMKFEDYFREGGNNKGHLRKGMSNLIYHVALLYK